jgi:hypothetical protein
MKTRLRLQSHLAWLLAIITPMLTISVSAETGNFGNLNLAPGLDTTQEKIWKISGYTGGNYSLSAISNRDRDRKTCIGFGDPKPDHILVLEKDFDNLIISVNSAGADTTLFIQGPNDQTIRCGDDDDKSKDASVSDRKWQKGTYRIWVGIVDQGIKKNYTLIIKQME